MQLSTSEHQDGSSKNRSLACSVNRHGNCSSRPVSLSLHFPATLFPQTTFNSHQSQHQHCRNPPRPHPRPQIPQVSRPPTRAPPPNISARSPRTTRNRDPQPLCRLLQALPGHRLCRKYPHKQYMPYPGSSPHMSRIPLRSVEALRVISWHEPLPCSNLHRLLKGYRLLWPGSRFLLSKTNTASGSFWTSDSD